MTADRDVKAVLRLHEALARVRADDRFPATATGGQTRALAEALLWAAFHVRGMDAGEERAAEYDRYVCRSLGMDWPMISRMLVYDDAPRFEPPDVDRYSRPCPVPLRGGPRVGEPCGKRGTNYCRETDPATGEWRDVAYCNAHEAYAKASRIAEQARRKAGGIPEPFPNRGGLLPCHARGVTNWPDLYAQARHGWKPPRVGIVRDDWPVMAAVVEKEPPRLALVAGGGTGGATDPDVPPAPIRLRLVGGDDD